MIDRKNFGKNIKLKYNSVLLPSSVSPNNQFSSVYNDNETIKDSENTNAKPTHLPKVEFNPYSQFTGLNPIDKQFLTESKKLNKNMEQINSDPQKQEDYYKTIMGETKKEIDFQKNINKKDHVKKLFATLNFPAKATSYRETFEYNYDKKRATLDHDFETHYKKSFMKTYEENKIMHKIILRK